MSDPTIAENERRFERALTAFAEAGRVAPCRSSDYRFCGQPVRLRIAGDTLARQIELPFAHLRVAGETPAQAGLTVDLWDAGATGVAGLPPPETHAAGRTWTLGAGTFAASDEGRFASHELHRSVAWLDRRRRHMVGWFADGGDLSLHQRGKPLQVLLALWASDRGLQAVHAGLVSRGDDGVLIPGRSGSGKSTVALSCLAARFNYVGDDWVGIESRDGIVRGHGLYATASLEPGHAARFPSLRPHAVEPRDGEEKSLILLPPALRERLRGTVAIRALALPRITGGRGAAVRPATKSEAFLVLAPVAAFTLRPRVGREGVERLAELAEQVPAHWIELGRDLDEIPPAIDQILADAGVC